MLTKILNADHERAKRLLELEPEEAMEQINALGNDFTLEEIREYGDGIRAVNKKLKNSRNDPLTGISGGTVTNSAEQELLIPFPSAATLSFTDIGISDPVSQLVSTTPSISIQIPSSKLRW